ncbi:MAG TPA: enoyl-CoA hydratase/isomerase family protein [Terriglobia bacterium]|nr:enoyl-CoA hydratase/isomerase family protein [Terriglobia bacterium]
MNTSLECVPPVRVERRERVLSLTLDRPPLNILDRDTIDRLRGKLEQALSDPNVRLVEIHGNIKAFCAGVEIRDHFPDRAAVMLSEFHALIRAVLYARVPVIAVVQGFCLGGGMELALASDFVVAADDATFGQPEIRVGCFAPVASVLLPCLIPEKKALELLLTAKTVSGTEAERLGLVNRAVPAPELDRALENLRFELLNKSPAVLALARKAARLNSRTGFEAALREAERIYLDDLLKTADATEGLQAFLEKREPEWKG